MGIDTTTDLESGLRILDERAEAAIEDLQRDGFRMDVSPPTYFHNGQMAAFDGRIPADLTQVNDQELGVFLGLLTGWINFANTKLSISDVRMRAAKAKVEFARARIRTSLPSHDSDGNKLTNPDKDQLVRIDQRYTQLEADYIYWSALVDYLGPAVKSAESAYSAVSRRITQRQNEMYQHGSRSNGHAAIPNYSPFVR